MVHKYKYFAAAVVVAAAAAATGRSRCRPERDDEPCMWCDFGGWNKPGCAQNMPCRAEALAFSECVDRLSHHRPSWRTTRPKVLQSECNARARELDACLSSAPPYINDIVGRGLDLYAVAHPSFQRSAAAASKTTC